MSKPTHIAYIVNGAEEAAARKKAVWREVGAVRPHKNGNGFDLVIPEQAQRIGPHRLHRAERKARRRADRLAVRVPRQSQAGGVACRRCATAQAPLCPWQFP